MRVAALGAVVACFGTLSDGVRASEPSAAQLSKIPEALPGAPVLPSELRKRLAAELAGRPSDYEPRTVNRRPDGSPEYSNRLLLESSPYLKQHAHNPVNWYPWGDEAFEAAKRLDRPVLVSVGYSTCHWCHVMEEETFDTVAAAQYLNEHFIAIKVDREARPDIDAVYMAAVHSMGVSGGWPLNVWVTPDRKPFYGGTYFPPERRGRRPGFIDVLRSIHEQYSSSRARGDEASPRIMQDVQRRLESSPSDSSRSVDPDTLEHAAAQAARVADRTWGGLGQRNKFPSSAPIRFWLRYHHRTGDPDALALATLTLEKMAQGGMHDHVGGGFHRYSTDMQWLVPHFEKMLYDNALLAVAYLEAGQLTGRDDFTQIARRTLDYVAAEMTSPEGVFYSATDADSMSDHGESEEGWFFTWTPEEVRAVVGAERAPLVSAYYGVTAEGNYEGRSVLHTWLSDEDAAARFEMSPEQVRKTLAAARSSLYEARRTRTPPARDDKVLVAWNGLMLGAFARAGWVLDEPRYVEIAERAAGFLLDTMMRNGRLVRVYQNGRADGPAFLEDYAFLIAGLLDVYEADSDPRWLRSAIGLQRTLDSDFADSPEGRPPAGYFQTAADHEMLLAREKPLTDGAIPSGNSVAAMNLLRLAEFTTDQAYQERALGLLSVSSPTLNQSPLATNEMLLAVDFFLDTRVEIIVITPADGSGKTEMLQPARSVFLPNRVFTVAAQNADLETHAAVNPLLKGRIARAGKTTAYLCKDRVCGFPTNDPSVFANQIADLESAQEAR